jgi:hypothetical protein
MRGPVPWTFSIEAGPRSRGLMSLFHSPRRVVDVGHAALLALIHLVPGDFKLACGHAGTRRISDIVNASGCPANRKNASITCFNESSE